MLMTQIWHLLEQAMLCPLLAGQGTKPFVAAQTHTCSSVSLTHPRVQAQHELCPPCRRPKECCEVLRGVWQLLKR